jgi:hypothetical protein
MPKVTCVQNVLFDGGQTEYVAGEEYDVPAALLKSYPDYFKQSAKAANKMAETDEDKAE